MSLMKERYEIIRKVANQENRKTGNMAREILERWAMNRQVRT
jgi:hypothetical protein